MRIEENCGNDSSSGTNDVMIKFKLPVNIYLLKGSNRILEKGVKYV